MEEAVIKKALSDLRKQIMVNVSRLTDNLKHIKAEDIVDEDACDGAHNCVQAIAEGWNNFAKLCSLPEMPVPENLPAGEYQDTRTDAFPIPDDDEDYEPDFEDVNDDDDYEGVGT